MKTEAEHSQKGMTIREALERMGHMCKDEFRKAMRVAVIREMLARMLMHDLRKIQGG